VKKVFVLLENVKDVNTFCQVESFEHVNGNGQDIYVRLMQESSGGCKECKLNRYMPSTVATVVATLDNLDCNLVVSRVAVQPFPADDRSIWKITIMPTDKIQGNITLVLTDGTTIETLTLEGRLVCTSTKSNRYYA
jgi:hypothetical protein